MRKFYSFIQLTLLILMISTTVFAQGTIHGIISDSTTSKPLIGANVFIVNTSLGSATNIEGYFRINHIPEGRHTLRVSYIGYLMKDVEIEVQDNKTTELNIGLSADVVRGEAVEVTTQAEGQVAAINQQLSSNTIINVVSEEKIQELPDANAAEAIGRLPGISLQRSGGEANRIVLRGLSDRFSTITIDGVRIAPTDAENRGVDLSTIAQGSLAGIELYKALTPDKDADAIAGSVNLVTKKAPSKRLLRADLNGSYNRITDNYDQYDFVLRYGERYFNDLLGLQFTGNMERKDRSNERINIDYDVTNINDGNDYEITEFNLFFNDELRTRNGISTLLDLNTPDGGSIRFNNIFNKTKRDFIEHNRNYTTGGDEDLIYGARDRQQEISILNSLIRGDNYLFDFKTDWSLSYAQSKSNYPFDFDVEFIEPSALDNEGNVISGMAPMPQDVKKGPIEDIIPYAMNNFNRAYLYTAFFRGEENKDTEKTAFLNLAREYRVGSKMSGELKFGGKYRNKSRFRSRSELFSPYYVEQFASYTKLSDGTVVSKDFGGTSFENLETIGGKVLVKNFLDSNPLGRDIYDRYRLYPMINRDALKLWWELNKNGFSDANGSNPEYEKNQEPDTEFYDIVERISSAYFMNTLNFGQNVTFIAGVRVERENNDYNSKFSPEDLSGFPVPKGAIRDTFAVHKETVWLPNFHLNYQPLSFMNIRLAAYKALARPDFNHRLNNFIARKRGTFYTGNTLIIGNPNLKAAKAWNYEINTSFFGNKIGLFSISVFYKDVKDMYHLLDAVPFYEEQNIDSLGYGDIPYSNPFEGSNYILTYPYNSTKPTHVWGFEIEHQTNFWYLPGLLRNVVLSYNFSVIRSETYIPTVIPEEYEVIVPGIPFPVTKVRNVVEERNQKLEGQPEFFGNVAVGYDFGGFSARLSVYYQDQYNRTFSPNRRTDTAQNEFTRWDLSIKQQITNNISILMNVNNLTNVEEGTSLLNRVKDWRLIDRTEKYDLTGTLGLRITL